MKAIIWDLDNCLADDGPRIPLIDWHESDPNKRYARYHAACGNDLLVNRDVFKQAHRNCQGAIPIFITGRPESVRKQTTEWVHEKLGLLVPRIFMRPDDNIQRSVDLKRTIVQSLKGLYEFVEAYDDHVAICGMYNAEFGIPSVVMKIHNLDAYRDEKNTLGSRSDGGHQDYLDRKADEWPVQGARPVPKQPTTASAADRLEAMAKTFRERNAVYRDNSRVVPKLMAALFPNGVPSELVVQEEFHLFELILVKLTRFCNTSFTHTDSIHDAAVYAAMIDAIILNRQQALAQQETSKA